MKLPYEQDKLIEELLAVNPNTVITFVGGSPVEMGSWLEKAKTVVWSWYAGMEGGNAQIVLLMPLENFREVLRCTIQKACLWDTDTTIPFR